MNSALALPRNTLAATIAVAALGGGALAIGGDEGWRLAVLYLIGGAMGAVLYRAAFGFTGAWRAFLEHGEGGGIRAQTVMLLLASAVFLPALDQGSLLGRPVDGAVAPLGLSVAVGAFLFGIGMQLGGGCASGTLFTAGGGSVRMVLTLVFFIAGSVIGTAHAPWWYALPALPPVALGKAMGWDGALILQGAVLAGIFGLTLWRERARTGTMPRHLVPVPLLWGAVALATLNVATLYVSGHPWSITFGFGLWGAKLLSATGIDVATWNFWTWPYPARALAGGIFAEDTSVMNFGILFGALLAAGLAGRFSRGFRLHFRDVALSIAGGLLLGYGARLAFGCNIGALFSGIASGSLHGWLWLACAVPGNWVGLRLRPVFAPR